MEPGSPPRARPAEQDPGGPSREPGEGAAAGAGTPGVKRLLCSEGNVDSPSSSIGSRRLTLSLQVTWHSLSSKCRHNCLNLRRVADVHDLTGLAADLMNRAFPAAAAPPHLAAAEARRYYHYTPEQECLSLPSDVARTTLKLVVGYDGWEYVVYERPLRTDAAAAAGGEAGTPLLLTVVEFESTALVVGHLGIQVQLVSYPVVSVRRDFLDDVDFRLRTEPSSFRGILS